MDISGFFSDTWVMLVGRVGGRMSFRLIMQPLMASVFAIRAGLKDAREGSPPYLWAIFYDPASRRDLLRRGWKDVRNVFIIAVVLDAVYQFIEFRWVYPGQAVIVAIVLAIVPYVLVRGPFSRLVSKIKKNTRAAPSSTL